LSQGEEELARVRDALAQAQTRVETYETVLDQAQEIEAGYERWATAREADGAFNALLAEQAMLLEGRAALEKALSDARAEWVARKSALDQQVTELQRRAAGVEMAGDLAAARQELAALAEREAERDRLQDQLAALGQELGGCRAEKEALEAKGAELNERLEKLEDLDTQATAACPLCGQTLSEEHRAELVARLASERDAMRQDWQANKSRIKAIQDETKALRQTLDQVLSALRRLPALQRREAELAQRVKDAQAATAELEAVQAEQMRVQNRLDAQDYAPQVRRELTALQAKLDALGYDAAAHRDAQRELAELAAFETRYAELKQARAEIDAARTAVEEARERENRWQASMAEDQAKQAALAGEIEQLEARLVDAERVEAEVETLRREESEARMRLGAAQQRLDACQALKVLRQERREEQAQLAEERVIYDELRVAFGKKGVPAMIIEAVLPEIEDSANALLSRMTNGRMHVRFETQREKVTGGVAETLDIQISDELGTRNYELYSGGEAFRINFAIRIALSQLLARRAGARLRTLVIDEGFGTQDAQGRERLVEAINAIQSDFERILVITHIDELKDAFPARIQVTKTAAGSQVEVI
jgi:exonuclease SbcC